MKKVITKPQFIFLLLAIISLIIGFIYKNGEFVISIESTYIIVESWSISMFTSIFLVLIAVNYTSLSFINKPHKRVLTIIHIVLQITALIPLWYMISISNIKKSYEDEIIINVVLVISFGVFLFATLIHLIIFFISLISKKD